MLQALIGPVAGLLDKFIEDADQKNALAHEIATLATKQAHEAHMGQIQTNQAEAAHRSRFVAGWRPMVGWVCAIALAYHFIMHPLLVFLLVAFGATGFNPGDLPEFDMDSLMTVLLGMLGLGGLRTFEKFKGVSK